MSNKDQLILVEHQITKYADDFQFDWNGNGEETKQFYRLEERIVSHTKMLICADCYSRRRNCR